MTCDLTEIRKQLANLQTRADAFEQSQTPDDIHNAKEIRDLVKQECIDAVNKAYADLGDAYTSLDMNEEAIKAIKGIK